MNSGVFIGGTSSNLQPQQHSNQKHNNNPGQQQVAGVQARFSSQQQQQSQPQQQQAHRSSSSSMQHPAHQQQTNHPTTTQTPQQHHPQSSHSHQSQPQSQQHLNSQQIWRQQQLQLQQQQADHHHSNHHDASNAESQAMQQAQQNAAHLFRGGNVVINGGGGGGQQQNHPPHLSQQAQQMLQHKLIMNQQQQNQQQQPAMHHHPQLQMNAMSQQQTMIARHHNFQGSSQQVPSQHHQQQQAQQQHLSNTQQQQSYIVSQQHQDGGTQQPHAPYNSKAQTQKVIMMQGVAGQKGVRALASANSYKQNQQSQQTQQQHQQMHQQQLRVQIQGQTAPAAGTLSPNAAGSGLRPGSNHRVLVPVNKHLLHPQQQQQLEISSANGGQQPSSMNFSQAAYQNASQERQPSAQSAASGEQQPQQSTPSQQASDKAQMSTTTTGGMSNTSAATGTSANAPSAADGKPQQQAPPRTYKEIRQRLHQQQQMQQLRLQQQQWIARQQQILLTNNPGATIEQVNAIIQQSIINQQQQMALQQQQAAQLQALQQQAAANNSMQSPGHPHQQLQVVNGQPIGSAVSNGSNGGGGVADGQNSNQGGNQAAVFPNGSLSSAVQNEADQNEEHISEQQQQILLQQQRLQQHQQQQQSQQQQQQQPHIIRLTKRQTGQLVGAPPQTNAAGAQQQVQIKQHGNGQMSIALSSHNVVAQAAASQQASNLVAAQLTVAQNQRNLLASSQQNLPSAATTATATTAVSRAANQAAAPKDENLMSYAQLLKQECQYEGGPSASSIHYKPNQLQQNLQPTNLPLENLKHTLQQLTSEILRKVLARSDSMNQLRQIIDLKAKKVKPKNYESSIFQTIMDKEQTRVKQEADSLAKQGLRVEDKTLIKYLRGQVKKMLKPFRGLQYDDYLNNEIHLNEIMATQDQQNDPIKESRKRHLRILDAALKEQVVDIHIVLGICVQISRQAFYNELQEYFIVAYDYIMANQAQFQQHDIQGITNLKKKLGSVRSNSKVQIQTTKKLDRMFWLLLEQNQEVRNNIRTYKERYIEKTEHGGIGVGRLYENEGGANSGSGGNHLNSASHLQRRHNNNNLRSSSGINVASPKVNAGGSSHNIFAGQNQKVQDGSVRRTLQKGTRTSSHQQESYNIGAGGKQANGAGSKSVNQQYSQSQDAHNDGVNFHATAGKAQQLLHKNSGKNSTLAPIPSNIGGKKAQSLIQKKMKARDLDRQLNSQAPTPGSAAEKTPEHSGIAKKRRMSSTKAGQNQLLSAHSQHQSATPQNFHPRSRTKHLTVINSSNNGAGLQSQNNNNISNQNQQHHQGGPHGSTSNNSTENLFNLIQATKTKNTMILEPLAKRHNKNDSQVVDPRDEIGSGLQSGGHPDRVSVPMSSQKSHRMRQTDYSRGFMSNLDMEQQHATAEMDPEEVLNARVGENQHAKVFRSWSRPQIGGDGHQISGETPDSAAAQQDGGKLFNGVGAGKVLKTTSMQVCTCAKFRKRIDPAIADISVAPLVSATKTSNFERTSMAKANSQTAKSDLGVSPDHPRLRNSTTGEEVIGADGPISPKKQDDLLGAKSEYKSGARKLQSQEEILSNVASPHDRKNQPRASQDFKMRILTKKKVTVPASATSQTRSQFNNSNASSASLEPHQKALGPNRQISGESGGAVGHPNQTEHPSSFQNDKNTASMLQRSKIVTYELCQDCGGQRPAGLPQVTSSLSEIKVKLQVSKVSGGYHSSNDEEFPGTARLNDSGRSSTLSIGRERKGSSNSASKHRSQLLLNEYMPDADSNENQALLGHNIQLQRVKAINAVEKCLNKRYLQFLGVQYYQGLQEFIVNSRAQRIQLFVRERLAERIFAAQIIQTRWRLHKKSQDSVQLRRAKLQHLRKKVAINRIYDLHRLIKVRKVTANSQLIQHQLWQQVQQSQESLGDIYLDRIILIQRKWRAILARKYLMGKALLAKKHTKQRIWKSIMNQKYGKIQCTESRYLFNETQFLRENKNLDGYFWKQMVGYAKDLETRAAKIEQRLNSDFVLADWTFESQAREWQNSLKSMTIKLEKHESSQVTVLRDKLVKFYVSNQLPSESAINKTLDEFVDAKAAMQKALKKDQDYKKQFSLQRIKRQRLENLFGEEPDILVEHV